MNIQNILSGFVLRPARSANGNTETTGTATSGVVRHFEWIEASDGQNILNEKFGSQYRSAFIEGGEDTEEYLLWAAQNGNISEAEFVKRTNNSQLFPNEDGIVTKIRIDDLEGKDIASVESIEIVVAVGSGSVVELIKDTHFTWHEPYAFLSYSAQSLLQGGFQPERGDVLSSASYLLKPMGFYWVKNDTKQRFGWNGEKSTWQPFKGSNIVNLGRLVVDELYSLNPKMPLEIGSFLKGDPSDPTVKATLRVGVLPTEEAIVLKVKVVTDEDIEQYDFASDLDEPDAVVGLVENKLVFDPNFVANHIGKFVWFSYEDWQDKATGIMASMVDTIDSPVFLTPIPDYTDRPMIRMGSRRHLRSIACRTEAELNNISVDENTFAWAESTGRCKFNENLLQKADPNSPLFDVLYYEDNIVYDGISHNTHPIPFPKAKELEKNGDNYTLPDAETLPNGLFSSGFLRVPDGTGLIPNSIYVEPLPNISGLVRKIKTVGDEMFFSSEYAIKNIQVVNHKDDLKWDWFIEKGTAMVCLDNGEVRFNRRDAKNLKESGSGIFFRQGFVVPARTIDKACIPSRKEEPYQVKKLGFFDFEINGEKYVCELNSQSTYTAFDLAQFLNTYSFNTNSQSLSDTGVASFAAYNGRLYLETADKTGSIKIGFGYEGFTSPLDLDYTDRDLAGCSALGFNAGWAVNTDEDYCFLNDSGMAFGLFRTPFNIDRESDDNEMDFYAVQKTEGFVGDVRQDFFHNLDQQPLKDMQGFKEGVFFNFREGLKSKDLIHYEDIVYQFDDERFMWVAHQRLRQDILTDTQVLSLSPNMALESSFISYFNNGVWVSNGSTYNYLLKDEDYLVLEEGLTGEIALIEPVGEKIAEGFSGESNGNKLSVEQSHLDLVQPNDRVKILGGSLEGSYKVQEVLNNKIVVQPQFADNLSNLNYQIFSGANTKCIHADKVLYETSHLPEETFIVRIVEKVGDSENGGEFFIDVGDAETFGREVFFRVGDLTDDSNDYTPVKIGNQLLGNPRNGVYIIDSPLLEREFVKISFGGGEFIYSKGNGNCHFVNTFSTNTGDYIEIGAFGSPIEGQVRFSEEAIENRGGRAYAVPDISDPTLLGHDEFYYSNRGVFVPSTQIGKIYLVQKAVLGLDVQTNPIGGALNFSKTLKKGMIVEARYYLADDDGNKLRDENGILLPQVFDQLPMFRRQVPISLTEHDPETGFFKAELDLGEDTLVQDGSIALYAGARLLNNYTTDLELVDNKVMFEGRSPSLVKDYPLYSDQLIVNYQVFEAEGGEQSFTTSGSPIFRPPFRLEEEQDTFTLETDRRDDFVVGGVIWIDGFLLKILEANYDGRNTEIKISPAPQKEIGSLSPANDSQMLVSGKSLFEDSSFWVEIVMSYLPADRGMTEIVFEGNLTEVIQTNSILQLGEDIFLVEDTELSDEGDFTLVKLQSPLASGYKFDTHPPFVSVRPIFAENDSEFELGESVPETYFELVLFEEGKVGRTLTEGVDYEGNEEEGEIRFLTKFQRGLQKGDVLWVTRTHLSELSPFFQNGQVVVPNVIVSYYYGYLRSPDGFIEGNYFYSQPDSFFCRVAKNNTYLSEVARDFAQSMNVNGSSGSSTGFSSKPKNFTKGILGSRGKYKNTLNQDQASRMFIEVYNRIVVGFEQVRETITGGFIGDRDGKFKFFVGRDNDLTPKGFENPFTGIMNPRNVWEDFFNDTLADLDLPNIPLSTEDAIVQPDSGAKREKFKLVGDDLNLSQIRSFLNEQKLYTMNDIDDLVLVGREGLRFDFDRGGFWTQGVYKSMGDNHTVSRLFPERTNMFMRTYAGTLIGEAGEHGVYTNGREVDEEWYSTKGTQIGAISNPVLGTINNISDLDIQKRLARGRVYDYSPTGFPEIEDALSVSIGERPAVVISVVPLKNFPTNSVGIPDTSRFVSISPTGEIFDASSGDYDLHTPPFAQGDKVYVGNPDGDVFPTNVFIEEVIEGCVLVFQDAEGNSITTSDDFATPDGDSILLSYGDSLFIGTNDYIPDAPEDPTLSEETELRGKQDAYTTWWDFALDRKSGKMIDKSFSSEDDNRFDWQGLLRQNPPTPFECLEGVTFFYNGDQQPAKLPCLLGEEKNDSGDYTLPYLLEGETELQVLGRMAKAFDFIFKQDAASGNNSVFPNEVTGRSGNLTDGMLLTDSVNFLPVNGSYTPRTGLADVRSYDLLLVEPIDSNYQSWQGILSVGSVTEDTIGVPRLITEINGVLDRYIAYNVMAHVATVTNNLGEGENGLVILEDNVNNYTTFDLSSQTTFTWEGFVDWFKQTIDSGVPNGNRNAARIQLINHATGTVLSELELHHTLNVGVSVEEKILQNGNTTIIDLVDMNTIDPVTYPTPNVVLGLSGTGWFDFGSVGTLVGGDPTVFFDFTLSLNTFDDTWGGTGVLNTPAPYSGSLLSVVGADRLRYDFGIAGLVSTVRETVHPNDNTLSLATILEILQAEHEFGEDYGDGYLMSNIHNSNLINGLNVPFSFLTDDFTIPSWEGSEDTPLVIEDIRFSAMASSDEDTIGTICEGEGFVTEGYLGVTCDIGNQDTTNVNPYVPTVLTEINGTLPKIQKGDILVIQPKANSTAITSGSYIIRNVVAPTDPANPYSENRTITPAAPAGYGHSRVLDTRPSKVKDFFYDSSTLQTTITLGRVRVKDFFDTGDGNRTAFPSVGSVYTFNTLGDEYEFQYDHTINPIVENEVINGFGSITFTISAVLRNGAVILSSEVIRDFINRPSYGETRFDFREFLRGYELTDPSVSSVLGIEEMQFFDENGAVLGTFDVPTNTIEKNALVAGSLTVYGDNPYTDHGTRTDEQIFTNGVATHIDISEALSSMGLTHFQRTYRFSITIKDLAGIFIEPSMPIPVQDLSEAEPRVVSNTLSMDNANVGMREITPHTDINSYPYLGDTLARYESVRFSVRRVRRWHDIQKRLNDPLNLLPPIYFKRKGAVVGWVTDRILELGDLYLFGGFGKGKVRRGDTLRILKDGVLVEEHQISATELFPLVTTREQIRTADIQANPTDYTYEVYLRKGMIPHEQSWDELVDIMTKEIVKVGDDGRCVVRNNLIVDDLVGVAEGDLVIVDPHPDGFRPMGDRGVPNRVGHETGLPSELDDNRGFYRVAANNGIALELDGVNEFAGLYGAEKIYGAAGQEYAVYPTINGTFPSHTPSPDGEKEAQNDLRPTAPIDPIDGYAGNYFSIEPFSYKIIRPTGLFSDEMIDLVLTQRERTLSWMEEILEPSRKNKAGDYHTFQLEDHILEIDDPTDISRGYGFVSNALMESLAGVRTTAPFLNTSDCLSVQDRRYWCGEYNLDYETPLDPADTTPFASFEREYGSLIRGSGRPHLVDRIDDILNSSDRLRNLRYTWISFRTNKGRGTLPAAKRARGVLLQDLYDEQALINIKKSVEKL